MLQLVTLTWVGEASIRIVSIPAGDPQSLPVHGAVHLRDRPCRQQARTERSLQNRVCVSTHLLFRRSPRLHGGPRRVLIESAQDRPSDATFTYNLGDLYAESGQTLQGSFSAVSKQASKQASKVVQSFSKKRKKRKAKFCK